MREQQTTDTTKPKMPLINDPQLRLSELQDLRTIRDELQLHIHLGTMEAREMYQELEDKWQVIQSKLPRREHLEDAIDAARDSIMSATPDMIAELKNGYRRLRDEIKNRMPTTSA